MKILYAFGWIPVPVLYVPWLASAGGFAPLFCILILEKYRGDEGMIAHEFEHIEQAWRHGIIGFALLYLMSKRYRMRMEVAAYRRQIAIYEREGRIGSREWAAKNLAGPLYRLGITEAEALILFQQ